MDAIKNRLKNNSWLIWLWPAAATLVGAIVRFSFITRASIWHDEGFSIMLARRSAAEIWAGSARDVHPPGYYLLLHYWIQFFGSGEVAIRSLSALAGIAIIPLGFLIVRKIAGLRAAALAAFLLALAPFLIRYSQEARMYGLLGLFLLIALFALMCIVERPKQIWPYVVYALAIAAGLYTHYFTVLAVAAFWLYLIILQSPKKWKLGQSIWLSWRWWVANIVAAALFLPWVPTMLGQLRRGQGLSWLGPATIRTLPDTLWQFFSFTDGRALLSLVYWLAPLVILAAAVFVWLKDKTEHKFARLLVLYGFVPIAIGLLISVRKPIFHERYFAFAAIAIYLIVAIAIEWLAAQRTWLFAVLATVIILGQCVGVYNVYTQANHQMRQVMNVVNESYLPSDKLIAGELYVYFDGTYYNQTGQTMQLYTGGNPPNGYGESGLLYNQNVYLDSYTQIPANSRVWLLGKTGQHDYYTVPANWQLVQEYDRGYSEIRLYEVK